MKPAGLAIDFARLMRRCRAGEISHADVLAALDVILRQPGIDKTGPARDARRRGSQRAESAAVEPGRRAAPQDQCGTRGAHVRGCGPHVAPRPGRHRRSRRRSRRGQRRHTAAHARPRHRADSQGPVRASRAPRPWRHEHRLQGRRSPQVGGVAQRAERRREDHPPRSRRAPRHVRGAAARDTEGAEPRPSEHRPRLRLRSRRRHGVHDDGASLRRVAEPDARGGGRRGATERRRAANHRATSAARLHSRIAAASCTAI